MESQVYSVRTEKPWRRFEIISLYNGTDIEIPQRGTHFSAGYDLQSAETVVIGAGETVLVPTGLKSAFPGDEFMAIYPRSSIAGKYVLHLLTVLVSLIVTTIITQITKVISKYY